MRPGFRAREVLRIHRQRSRRKTGFIRSRPGVWRVAHDQVNRPAVGYDRVPEVGLVQGFAIRALTEKR